MAKKHCWKLPSFEKEGCSELVEGRGGWIDTGGNHWPAATPSAQGRTQILQLLNPKKIVFHLRKGTAIVVALLCGLEGYAAFEDRSDGLTSPSLFFLPRKAREAFIFHEPSPLADLSRTYWLEEWDERELEREGASEQALDANSIFEKRVGGLVSLKTRPHDKVDAERIDFRGRLLRNDRFGDGLTPDARTRVRVDFGDVMGSGLVAYYRHREREVGRERELTKWATALDTAGDLGQDARFIDEHETRDSPEEHTMDEVGARLDWWITPRTSVQVSGVYRQSDEQLVEQRQEFDTRSGTQGLPGLIPNRGNQYTSGTIEDGTLVSGVSNANVSRIEYQLKDELEEKKRHAFDGALRHEFSERIFIQLDGEYAYKEKAEPDRQDYEFAREDTGFSYELRDNDGDLVPLFDGGAEEILDGDYGLRKLEQEDNLERQWFEHYRAFVQFSGSNDLEFQTGLFLNDQLHDENIDYRRFEDPDWQNAGELFQADAFLDSDGRLDPESARGIDPSILDFNEAESRFKSFAEDFDSRREIRGGWAQLRWEPSKQARLTAGIRYEESDGEYTGFNAQWNGSEDFGNIIFPRVPLVVSPVSEEAEHRHWLPLLRAEYQPRPDLYFAVEARQSLQRGKLWELSATEAYDLDGGTAPDAILGNPQLEPSVQDQVHATANFAYAPGSMLRIYAEYWDLSEPIARASWFQPFQLEDPTIDNNFQANYRFEQTINADSGSLYRAGANWAHLLSELAHPFDQIGVFASVELTRSEQSIRVDGTRRSTDLVSMPEFRSTFGLYYDSPRWNILFSGNYHDDYLFRVGENRNGVSGAGDQFVAARLTANLGVEYKFSQQLEVSAEVRNLFDSALRFYEGTEDRQTYREFTGRSMFVGVHLFF